MLHAVQRAVVSISTVMLCGV